MKFKKPDNLSGDFWGGLAAMLVALPSAIAFGVTIYSPLGGSNVAQGALAGILGVTALGMLAPMLGGTNRLISAPCAPAAAVLSAFVIEFLHQGNSLESALLMLSMLGLVAGMLQVGFGTVGLGRMIKYMPYSVVSGYLSGVGLYIIASQVPKFLGAPKGVHFWESLELYSTWKWQGIVVGLVTVIVMLGASKITKSVPAAILALLGGVATYFALGYFDGSLLSLDGNTLVVGPLSKGGASFTDAMVARLNGLGNLDMKDVQSLLFPALTLAVLLSIDTLKTCVVLDALTRSRHNSNRELIGQGIGNIASAAIGGIPGAGTMGATLVNMSGGASSRLSGVIEGVLALVAFLLLGSVIAWVPVAGLAGILIVIGLRMIDIHALHLLKSRSTVLDFVVIISVVIVALTVSLIAASGVGVLLAVVLFVREEISNKIMRRKTYGNETFSKQIRVQEEMEILAKHGKQAVIYELQGSLFFGTADQLYTMVEPELKVRRYVILDMRRVQSVDMTAAHILEQIKDILAEHKGYLLLSQIPKNLPSGKDMKQYFDHIGLVREGSPVLVFNELDEAVEWVEDRIIEEASLHRESEELLDLHEIELFKGRKPETITALEGYMEKRSYKAGEMIFNGGDTGDELFVIRRGEVRILLAIDQSHTHHISTFGRGAFFGEMSFLDGKPRSARAVAYTDTDLYGLSRAEFSRLSEDHKKVAISLLDGLARVLAGRLRYANAEIHALDS
ncbi:MAG: cyclic nucleotide-binding domain-containing protein [Methylophilales bacterium]|nr:cyclic nucleotide-binding domain-containing protein [Methylophilales bacterium]